MFKQICVLLVSLFMCRQALVAQSDTASAVKKWDTIQVKDKGYFYNNRKMSAVRLGPLLSKTNASKNEYKIYTNREVTGAVLLIGSVASGILAIAYPQQKTPFLISTVVLGGVGIPLMLNARKHLRRSVVLFNDAVRK